MTEILCDNIEHKQILDNYLQYIKGSVYYITEEHEIGKFGDFMETINAIIAYSNEFREDNARQNYLMNEWRYMIPNLVVFASIGFLAGINRESISNDVASLKKRLFRRTSEIIGETYDIYADDVLEEEFKVNLKEI
jgi:hypothetical protein|tara:strand:+ start:2047 stop:2454 length:408 start_codon:yes stop_codon:yes gene_type:complete